MMWLHGKVLAKEIPDFLHHQYKADQKSLKVHQTWKKNWQQLRLKRQAANIKTSLVNLWYPQRSEPYRRN